MKDLFQLMASTYGWTPEQVARMNLLQIRMLLPGQETVTIKAGSISELQSKIRILRDQKWRS